MAEPDGNRSLTPQAVAAVLLLCVLWGGLLVSIKVALDGVPPILLAVFRFIIGAASILIWARITGIELYPPREERGPLIIIGLVMFAQIVTMNIGTQLTSGSHAVVFMQGYPFFVAVIAHYALLDDRISLLKSVGLLMAGAGIVVTMSESLMTKEGAFYGDSLVILSAVILGIQTIIMKSKVSVIVPERMLFWQMIVAIPLFLTLSLITERYESLSFNIAVWLAILYQGVVVAGFCFVVWLILLKRYSASRVSAFFFTTPLFGVTLSWLVLGDSITVCLLAGLILVAGGLYLINKE
ncbi:MAG: DMT family transporter [Gemmatimonadota bacterium]|nr:DMT family transporter [Gemmatimonadota bacterium]